MANSSTHQRKISFYLSPQNKIRLDKIATSPEGDKKDGVSKNKIVNTALDNYFKSIICK